MLDADAEPGEPFGPHPRRARIGDYRRSGHLRPLLAVPQAWLRKRAARGGGEKHTHQRIQTGKNKEYREYEWQIIGGAACDKSIDFLDSASFTADKFSSCCRTAGRIGRTAGQSNMARYPSLHLRGEDRAMRSRLYSSGIVAALLLLSTGCCAVRTALYEPFGPGSLCDPTHCGAASCGPVAVSDACSPGCGVPADPCNACGPCEDRCAARACGPCGRPWGPLSWVFDIFFAGYCGDGCGELYWSDFHSEPPDCCDPCDRLGNWTGGAMSAGATTPHGGCPTCGQTASQVRSVPTPIRMAQQPTAAVRPGTQASHAVPRAGQVPSRVQRSTTGSTL